MFSTIEEEFRFVLFPMLDAFIHGIEERFTLETFDLVSAMQGILSLSAGDEQH